MVVACPAGHVLDRTVVAVGNVMRQHAQRAVGSGSGIPPGGKMFARGCRICLTGRSLTERASVYKGGEHGRRRA